MLSLLETCHLAEETYLLGCYAIRDTRFPILKKMPENGRFSARKYLSEVKGEPLPPRDGESGGWDRLLAPPPRGARAQSRPPNASCWIAAEGANVALYGGEKMAPFPEEVDVFTAPHWRMKQLVGLYCDKLSKTNFSNNNDFRALLQSLYATFKEFKMHEQIENEYIIGLLQQRSQTVYNVHSDNKLSEMLSLFEKGLKNVKVSLLDFWHG
uniref:F-box/LRR-repeat protein 5 n=1 Tax=Laticauda laticaudata TaxID=8630 RepID=A0A8C5WTB5_LATLA